MIVGATFVGQGVGELLHSATIAIVGEVTLDRLRHAVPAFPTISEVWLRLLETAGLSTGARLRLKSRNGSELRGASRAVVERLPVAHAARRR